MGVLNTGMIAEAAAGCGLDLAGVTGISPLEHLRQRLEQRHCEGRVTPFEENQIDHRLDPRFVWPAVKSLIVVASSYLTVPGRQPAPAPDDEPRGKVARCARGFDYHRQLEIKTKSLAAELQKRFSTPFNYRFLADRSPLIERELARLAGLGIIVENCHLINPARGSYLALGTLLIDREIEPSPPPGSSYCQSCGLCRRACPTGALIAPHTIDPARCLSYLTQSPGIIPRDLRPLMGNLLYGCDLCQEVCPYNRVETKAPPAAAVSFPFFPAEPALIPLLTLTGREFSSTIGLTAAGWRGKTPLQRNAVVALGNAQDRRSVKPLARLLARDPRPVIRVHAAWSLGAIGGSQARFYLEKSLQSDPDQAVREEAGIALERIG